MSKNRVEVVGDGEFDAREWLRREVLWASLMTPYSQQWAGWLDETQIQQHNGNVSRQDLYARDQSDVEAQAMSFFNQGKNVGCLISSVALFRTRIRGATDEPTSEVLEVQASSIDRTLTPSNNYVVSESEASAYQSCTRLAQQRSEVDDVFQSKKQKLLRASKVMLGLAVAEAKLWVATSEQSDGDSLPTLVINNGGHPRSAGPRVEALQPVFHDIVASEEYQALATRQLF